jgi:DNA transformation protein and related proteins
MAVSAATLAFVTDLLSAMPGAVSPRRMFGGVGLYADGVMFGLIDDERLFLKTDATLQGELAAAGGEAWIYSGRKSPTAGTTQESSYWSMPEAALDDPEAACAWARRALAAARSAQVSKPRRRRETRAP